MSVSASDTQQQFWQSEAWHHLLLGSVAQTVWETDTAGVVVGDSPSWRAYTGQTQTNGWVTGGLTRSIPTTVL